MVLHVINHNEFNSDSSALISIDRPNGDHIAIGPNGRVDLNIKNSSNISGNGGVLVNTQDLVFGNFNFFNAQSGAITSKDALHVGFDKTAFFQNDGTIKSTGADYPVFFKKHHSGDAQLTFINTGNISLDSPNGILHSILRIEVSQGSVDAELTNTGIMSSNKNWTYLASLYGKVNADLKKFKVPVRTSLFNGVNDGAYIFSNDTKLIFTPDDSTENENILNFYSRNRTDGIFTGSTSMLVGDPASSNFATNDEESWKVELIRDEATPDDWKTHKVRVYYEARQDAGSQMNVYLNRAARDRAFRYESLLEPMKVRKDRNVFVRPFTAQSNYRFVDDSTIETSGALMGFSVRTGDAYEHGVHFGYESTDFESESGRQNADTDSLTLGYHAWWRPAEDFYVKGVASGTYSSNDFTYHALQDSAKTDFDSWSFFGYLKSGYDINAGGLGVFTPEVGLSYIHGSADDFGLDFAAEDLTDRRFHLKDNNDLYASAELKWRAEIDNGSGAVLLPRASIGARALLTDRKLEAQSSWGEERQTAEIDDDRWQGTAEIGVGILSGSLEFDLVYSGAYSRNTTSHAAWLTMGWHW